MLPCENSEKAEKIPNVVAIMGPTASGKSNLALRLAEKYNGEIISADSAQVYQGTNIGTAKPNTSELQSIPHHLVNIRSLNENFSLADFITLASDLVKAISKRGHLPIIAGGTGLYIRGFLEGYTLIEAPPDQKLRETLSSRTSDDLIEELRQKDPLSAQTIDLCNKRRVIRALEVIYQTGKTFSECSKKSPPNIRALKMGIRTERSQLVQKIDTRLDAMLKAGWLEEVEKLHKEGFSERLRFLRILGYNQLLDVVEGKQNLAQAKEDISSATKRFAKRQVTWLKSENGLLWLDGDNSVVSKAGEEIDIFINH